MLTIIERALGGIKGKKVALLGLAFKADVDDLRESPAIEAAHLLVEAGAVVSAYEPFKPDFPVNGVSMTHSLPEAIKDADLVVLLVGHTQFKTLDPRSVAAQTSARIVLDTVNGWNDAAWQDAGFTLFKLGRG